MSPTKKKSKKTATKKVKKPETLFRTSDVETYYTFSEDARVAVFDEASKAKENEVRITPRQMLTTHLRFLLSYAQSFDLDLPDLVNNIKPFHSKSYSVDASVDMIKQLQKELRDKKKRKAVVNTAMRSAKTTASARRSKTAKKAAQTRKSKATTKTT